MEQQSIKQMDTINNHNNYSVDVIIPTYHSDEKLDNLLQMLYRQTKKPNRVILLHTEEFPGAEQKIPEIKESNILIIPVTKKDFDHGGTRKYGASLSSADILMFMTQDAVPADELLLEKLLEPYDDPWVAATYARQLPTEKDDVVERYTRHFNYPKTSRVKALEDIDELGIKTFFCSNVCATYRNSIYKKMGGFVNKTIFNEDMIMAASIIRADYRIAYVAEAKVVHSHQYSYFQQFTRNFDLGVSHNQYVEVFHGLKSESEGIKLVKNTLGYLIEKKKYYLIPELIINSGFKYLGYQLGVRYDILPKNFIVRCSMNKSYWK
ncbi:MAG: rfbN [Herbinix sp.]|jgi:rhamnosyltransferase|nr:rfbN [Herbinix sp.]